MDGGQFHSFYSFPTEATIEQEPYSSTCSVSSNIDQRNMPWPPQDFGKNQSLLGSSDVNAQDWTRAPTKDQPSLAKHSKVRVKNSRTKFSVIQKLELDNAFYRTPYPSAALRAQLADKFGLRPQVVQNWFKKRRYRWRRKSPNLVPPQTRTQCSHCPPQDTVSGFVVFLDPCGVQEPIVHYLQSQRYQFYGI